MSDLALEIVSSLKEREIALLIAYVAYVDEQEEKFFPPDSPTLRQLGDDAGISSTSVVTSNLHALAEKGIIHYVKSDDSHNRGKYLLDNYYVAAIRTVAARRLHRPESM
jgi:hypothetical protein